MRQRHCHGLALVSAMLVVALVSATAVALSANLHVAIRRADNVFAGAAARAVEAELQDTAVALLRADAEQSGYDSDGETWASTRLDAVGARNGITGHAALRDLDGRFNLNNLVRFTRGAATAAAGLDTQPADVGVAAHPSARQAPHASVRPGMDAVPGDDVPAAPGTSAANARNAPLAARVEPGVESDLARQNMIATGTERLGEPIAGVTYFDDPAPGAGAETTTGGGAATDARGNRLAAAEAGTRAGGEPAAFDAAGNPVTTTADDLDADADAGSPANRNPTAHAEAGLRLLLRALDIDMEIAQAIFDWVDTDSDTRYPNGAEDDYYLELEPAYRAANRAFVDIRELRLVRGVTPEIFARLAPFLTALPIQTPVNVNTASLEVLMSLSSTIDRGTAEHLVRVRGARPFLSVDEFQAALMAAGRPRLDAPIAVHSRYFELATAIEGERVERRVLAVLNREGNRVVRRGHSMEDFE